MESTRFDVFTRAIAYPASRRRALAAVVAVALAPLTAAAKPAPAKCLPVGKRCSQPTGQDARHGHGKGAHDGQGNRHPPSCAKCCSRHATAGPNGKPRCSCKPDGDSCDNPSQCCGGLCRNGSCTKCPGDLTACNGACVDLQTDASHCGSCEQGCDSGQRCVAGTCVCDGTSCPRGCCGGSDGTTCQRGTSDQACGDGGAPCHACDTCHSCDGTTCAAQSNVCCGAKAVCANGVCTTCDDGQRCAGGACVCDATSCGDGCCQDNACQPGAEDDACGTGGAACKTCTGNDTCGGGNPGMPGVCGCTPDCTGKCGGADDGCGGTCTAACDAGKICLSQRCVTGQGTCTAGDNTCASANPIYCDGSGYPECACYLSIEGDTRCANRDIVPSYHCASTANCVAAHPSVLGVFCAQKGSGCGDTACYAPCPR